jgi:tetratricopeptide (TPR) repeat protein
MRRAALVLASLAAVASRGCTSSSQATRKGADLDRAMPAELEPAAHHTGDVRVAKVRIFADADFRARTPRWKQHITDELDYANALLTPMLGVRLEISEIREWDHAAAEAPLRETLAALAHDDASDASAWVIGYTAPAAASTTAFDELGTGELFGRYLVVRGYADEAERKAFAHQFPDVPLREAGDALDARRRHKQTCVLLHQLGHTLGAIHESDPSWIMHITYDPQQATLSERNRELMQIALEDRLKIKELRDPTATAGQMLAAIEKGEWGGWVAAEKDDEVTALRAIVDAAKKGATAPDVPVAIYDQYQHVERLAQQGRGKDALVELDPLIAAYPGNAQIRLLACKIQLGDKGPPTEVAKTTCARAAELAEGDPGPHLALAQAYAAASDKASARAELGRASGKVPNLKEGQIPVWTQIAQLYQQLGDVTHAEDAAHKAGSDGTIAAWASRTRARYGDPRDGARWRVTPDNEADYVDTVRKILDLVYANDFAGAGTLARTAEARWPGSPGVASARCDLAIRQNQDAAAAAHCKAAIAAFPGDSWAQYLLGILALKQRDPQPGIASLKKAIAADPELAQAWRALAKALERANATADLEKLRSDYQAAFGQPLP